MGSGWFNYKNRYDKQGEVHLIKLLAFKLEGWYKIAVPIIKIQEFNDDGETDGIIFLNGKNENVEARRKGFPNHSGERTDFDKGWDTYYLVNEGIFLNTSTIKRHRDNGEGFFFVVEIKGGGLPRVCYITPERSDELLKQPYRQERSTNTGKLQSVKCVPVKWFLHEK